LTTNNEQLSLFLSKKREFPPHSVTINGHHPLYASPGIRRSFSKTREVAPLSYPRPSIQNSRTILLLICQHDCYLKLKSELFKKVHFSPFADILEVIGGIAALPKRFDFVMFAPRRKTHVE
jgi:hypothetical protein